MVTLRLVSVPSAVSSGNFDIEISRIIPKWAKMSHLDGSDLAREFKTGRSESTF